jgi:hypothetical protein
LAATAVVEQKGKDEITQRDTQSFRVTSTTFHPTNARCTDCTLNREKRRSAGFHALIHRHRDPIFTAVFGGADTVKAKDTSSALCRHSFATISAKLRSLQKTEMFDAALTRVQETFSLGFMFDLDAAKERGLTRAPWSICRAKELSAASLLFFETWLQAFIETTSCPMW